MLQLSTVQVANAQSVNFTDTEPFQLQVAFDKAERTSIKEKKWLTLLWSVDCPPCMKELALVQILQQQKKISL